MPRAKLAIKGVRVLRSGRKSGLWSFRTKVKGQPRIDIGTDTRPQEFSKSGWPTTGWSSMSYHWKHSPLKRRHELRAQAVARKALRGIAAGEVGKGLRKVGKGLGRKRKK